MNPEADNQCSIVRTVSGADTELFTEATGHGPILLMVHGWTLNHHSFDFQIAKLAERFTVVTMDRRGCGLSSGSPALSREVDDLDLVIDSYGGGPVHLLGVSQGGRVALRYAATRSEKVRSLILQGAMLDGFEVSDAPGEAVPLDRYRELIRTGNLAAMRHEWLQHPLINGGVEGSSLRSLLRSILDDYSGEDLIAPVDTYSAVDLQSSLANLAIPTLIITGSLEIESRKQHANRLLQLLPEAAEVILEGAGHLSNLTHPARYNELVLGFCGAIENRQSTDAADSAINSTVP